jgi:choline dehydrogenase-like flavoprotein
LSLPGKLALIFFRGKMLGGSTGINLLAWDRASKLEYDSWQSFINGSDWNFDSLLPYFIKSETVDLTDNDVFPGVSKQGYVVAQKEFQVQDGFDGPVRVRSLPLILLLLPLMSFFFRHRITRFMETWPYHSLQRGITWAYQQIRIPSVSHFFSFADD